MTVLGSAKEENNVTVTKEIGGHIPGYITYETTGSVLDHILLPTVPKNSVIDHVKYNHDFNLDNATITLADLKSGGVS